MSMVDENLRALKRTHEFMRSLLVMRKQTFRKMTKEEFDKWQEEVYYCIKHFPFDYQLDGLYESIVCKECGQPVEFHKSNCKNKGEG
jgi:hypothetical protein